MVDRNISFADLKGVIHYLVREIFGDVPIRFRPSYFPFVEPGAEIDLLWNRDGSQVKNKTPAPSDWLEIGGCGMVHPNVLHMAGVDPDRYSGFAFGLGIERIAMIKNGIGDLRSFFENDYRMLEQFE